ncbi:transglycosylase family protein [Streptomyces meridianus]|uniref:Transglycosylase family protein n=1 Tax=Streptomyces meridianus TaxID=2938945 RepID=A0ABT0XCT6_9ACTN|nr:transglycosylase family protein [Streptomyces meridianus]MCM2580332.1 transglycosylase family protein [Streptomyces meridianus]
MSARGRHRRPSASARFVSHATLVIASSAGVALVGASGAQAASVDTWDKVAECESSGNWKANTGNGFFGGLQFTESTWNAFGGTKYAPRADQATKDQQIAIAEEVLAVQGPGAWPVCSGKAGLTKGGAAPEISPDAAPKPQPKKEKPAPKPAGGEGDRASTYTVVPGDSLYGIAESHDVRGGWQALYKDNRETVGDDPRLILPGQKLSLDGEREHRAAPKHAAPKAAEKPAKPAAPKKAAAPAAAPGFSAPVGDLSIGTPYHQAGGSWSSGYHTGVDFPVPTGTPVKSVADGEVVSAGQGGSYGNEVVIRHADGKYSQYAHLSQLSVSAGQTVKGGQQLGLSGATGNVSGPHLHLEVRTGQGYGSDIDPVAYLRSHGINL